MTVTNSEAAPGTATAASEALAATATPLATVTEQPAVEQQVNGEVKPSAINEKPAEPAAEPFDAAKLTLPDNFKIDTPEFKQFTDLATETKLDTATAQKFLDLHKTLTENATKAIYEPWTKQQETWVAEMKADPELKNMDEVRSTVAKVLDNPALTDPKFREAMDFTGAGNHPAVVRSLFRWAKALSEGSAVSGSPAKAAQPKSAAQALYPNLPSAGVN